jgi:phage repressor protein C with HTH and peptisase S24 domain
MTIKERLTQFIQYKGISMGAFERACSLSNGFVCKVGDSIRRAKLENISAIYPELNTNWLLTGVGSMLNEEESKDTYINKVEDVEYHLVPVVPYSAMGGTPTEFLPTGVRKNECEHIISPIKADIVVQVTGDSMAPVFPSGSRVLAVKINSEDFIEWGRIYILVTDSGFVIKQVRKSDKDGYVSCFSFNDNSIYAPFDIAINKIREWYIVKGSLALH